MDTIKTITILTNEDREYIYTISAEEYNRLKKEGILNFAICERTMAINLYTRNLRIANKGREINFYIKEFTHN